MVFASMPSYLDPANWQPQPNHHQISGRGASTQLLPPPPPPPQPNHVGPSTVRPSPMTDRARMANMYMPETAQKCPETAQKCPRCDSSNTKFCYLNNYSLSQPRHFCKTCRRYWTRGGALRNVPVGGWCRRNKRIKSSSSSKSHNNGEAGSSSTSAATPTNSTGSSDLLGGLTSQLVQPPTRFNMSQFHRQLSEFGIGENIIGLNNYGGISVAQSSGDLNFLLANTNTSSSTGSGAGIINGHQLLSGENLNFEQWRIIPQMQQQQFPFLAAGLDPSSRLLHNRIEGGSSDRPISYLGGDTMGDVLQLNKVSSVPPVVSQLGLLKFEGSQNQEVNLSRQFAGNDQLYWNNNGGSSASTSAWTTDLSSGFNNSSSTASHPVWSLNS